MIDNLTICGRCGSNACYVQEITKEIHTHFCYGCGFQTNTASLYSVLGVVNDQRNESSVIDLAEAFRADV